MITSSTFQEYLSSKESLSSESLTPSESLLLEPLPSSSNRSVSGQEHHLLKLLATLPSQTQAQQALQLEKILTVLREINIEGRQRLKLMTAVIDASDPLIASLRQHYIYEIDALSDAQMAYMAQVKSLYYLIIMVYDRVIRYKQSLLSNHKKQTAGISWQRYFKADNASTILATAIYKALSTYQKLLGEDAICYQKPSSYLWLRINQLYSLACERHVANLNLNITKDAKPSFHTNTIHQRYGQICLLSLLNVRAMPRSNILIVQRLLPEWSEHITATIEPKTETRVFVDLNSDQPPTYLTANSDINPYEDHHHCLFIELAPMVDHLRARVQTLIKENSEGIECHLLNKIAMTMTYRYLQPQPILVTKYPVIEKAVMIIGFNKIHYCVSGSQNFRSLIAMNDLPKDQWPRYDTSSQKQDSGDVFVYETLPTNPDASLFRTLELITKAESLLPVNKFAPTAPPPLSTMSLFLLCRSEMSAQPHWSMGMVRWLNLDTKDPEVEWQVLGHALVACGLRLEGSARRSQYFVPAFVLGRDEQLQTRGTLIVPTAYFQTDDRVIMRISTKQTPLRLGKRLLVTDEFSQYEVVTL